MDKSPNHVPLDELVELNDRADLNGTVDLTLTAGRFTAGEITEYDGTGLTFQCTVSANPTHYDWETVIRIDPEGESPERSDRPHAVSPYNAFKYGPGR